MEQYLLQQSYQFYPISIQSPKQTLIMESPFLRRNPFHAPIHTTNLIYKPKPTPSSQLNFPSYSKPPTHLTNLSTFHQIQPYRDSSLRIEDLRLNNPFYKPTPTVVGQGALAMMFDVGYSNADVHVGGSMREQKNPFEKRELIQSSMPNIYVVPNAEQYILSAEFLPISHKQKQYQNCDESPHFQYDYQPQFAGNNQQQQHQQQSNHHVQHVYHLGSLQKIPLDKYTTNAPAAPATPTTFADLGMRNLYSSKNIQEQSVERMVKQKKRESQRRSQVVQFNQGLSHRSLEPSGRSNAGNVLRSGQNKPDSIVFQGEEFHLVGMKSPRK